MTSPPLDYLREIARARRFGWTCDEPIALEAA